MWGGLWAGIAYVCALLVALELRVVAHHPEEVPFYTNLVGYGIGGAFVAGALLSAARLWWLRRPLARLREAHAEALEAARRQLEGATAAGGARVTAAGGADDAVAAAALDLRRVVRFASPRHVEVCARVMRVWDEDDGRPDEAAVALGEFVLRCGLARFPGDAALLAALAGVAVEARKDGAAARGHLQLASKAAPGLVARFFIYKVRVIVSE